MTGSLPSAIRGIWAICIANKYILTKVISLLVTAPPLCGAPDLFRNDGHNQLVENRGKEECDQCCRRFGELVIGYRARIDMPEKEGVYRLVPFSREFVP
jgi:hypothetical protein